MEPDGIHLFDLGRVCLTLLQVSLLGVACLVILPNLLDSSIVQSSKAKQAEAKNSIGTINRGQQAYHLEKNAFSSSVPPANFR